MLGARRVHLLGLVVLVLFSGRVCAQNFEDRVPRKNFSSESEPYGDLSATFYANVGNPRLTKDSPFPPNMDAQVRELILATSEAQKKQTQAQKDQFVDLKIKAFTSDEILGFGFTATFTSRLFRGQPRALKPEFVQLVRLEARKVNNLGQDYSPIAFAQVTPLGQDVATKATPYPYEWTVDQQFKKRPTSAAYQDYDHPYLQVFTDGSCTMWDRPGLRVKNLEQTFNAGADETLHWNYLTWITSNAQLPLVPDGGHLPLGYLDWPVVIRVTVGGQGAGDTRGTIITIPDLIWEDAGTEAGAASEGVLRALLRDYYPRYGLQ